MYTLKIATIKISIFVADIVHLHYYFATFGKLLGQIL